MEETPFYFRNENYNLFGVLHHSVNPNATSGFVFCHPLAEEKLWAHRVYVTFARELARRGFFVLRFDCMGEGDSDGLFEESNISTRLSDTKCAIALLKKEISTLKSIGLFGLRFGATMAAIVAEEIDSIDTLILWDPIINGEKYMQDLLRVNLATQSAIYKEIRKNREELVESMANGETVNIDGYDISYPLYVETSAINLLKEKKKIINNCLIVQIDRGAPKKPRGELVELNSLYNGSIFLSCSEEPFWKEIKRFYQNAENLYKSTFGWLDEKCK